MRRDVIARQVAGRDDRVVGLVGNLHLAQLALHGVGGAGRIGDHDHRAALFAERLQGLTGRRNPFTPSWITPQTSLRMTSTSVVRSRKRSAKRKAVT
jgi:hypothetical protein